MFEPNVAEVLRRLTDQALVLDVGGWACPFNRAQWVLDSEPYESRGFYREFGGASSQGGAREWFTKETWIQRDMCAREPWPFADKQFDYVICSHTLEDLRDPLWVCAEMVRVGKRGYVEVPSRIAESTRGLERPGVVGLSHHRWLIDIEAGDIRFLQKFHFIHSHWRFSLPLRHLKALPPEQHVQWLFWDGGFRFQEVFVHGLEAQERLLEEYAQRAYPRSQLRLRLDRLGRRARWRLGTAVRRCRGVVGWR
jgi:SAM-dependent methyltransferase